MRQLALSTSHGHLHQVKGPREMNHVTISGNLTADPEAKETKSDKSVTTFRIAVNSSKDRDAEFFNVVCFETTAENVLNYLSKGRSVAISGRLSHRSWR